MKSRLLINVTLALAGAVAAVLPASAQTTDPVDGEVRRINKDINKITLRHGELKALDMPPMTMVFTVRDPALLDRIKVGDKVRFRAEKADGVFYAIDVQVVQ